MEAYLIDAGRTPFRPHRGGLAGVRADDLAALPIVEPMRRRGDRYAVAAACVGAGQGTAAVLRVD